MIFSDSMSLAQSLDKGSWKDPWIKMIKEELHQLAPKVTMLWVPSHCDLEGSERADELAHIGTGLEQTETIVMHKIVKAKIKSRIWKVSNPKAAKIYGEKRV